MPKVGIRTCAFCGHGATLKRSVLGTVEGHRVVCTNCHAEGPFSAETETIAKLRWNQRVQLDKIAKISRHDPQSINKAAMSGMQMWSKHPDSGKWEQINAARSSDGTILVRTVRSDWVKLGELIVGEHPEFLEMQE